MKEKMTIIMIIGVIALVIATLALFTAGGPIDSFYLMSVPIIIVLIIGALYIAKERAVALKQNLPAEDELSKKSAYKAGYYAFIAAIWISVGVGLFEELIAELLGQEVLRAGQATGIVVLGTGIVFIVCAIIFKKKGIQ